MSRLGPLRLIALLSLSACERALYLPDATGQDPGLAPTTAPSTHALACGTRGTGPCPPGFLCEFSSGCSSPTDVPGTCQPIPSDCTGANSKQGECGCDGVTYSNGCLRRQAGVALAYSGPCDPEGGDCEAASGYCEQHEQSCKPSYVEATWIEQAHPGVCGLGICCLPYGD